MKKICFIFFLFFNIVAYAQTYFVTGYINDNEGNALQGVYLIINGTRENATSNKEGFYKLKADNKTEIISVFFLGYVDKIIPVKITGDTILNIVLEKSDNIIDEVEIVGEREFEKSLSERQLTTKFINVIPSIGGEKDILKALLFIPGVQSGNEATNGIFVRGGNSDQNLILLDNMPVYNVSHLFGYMSIFDVDMTEGVSIIKAGYPSSYGGRLSSVVNIDLKNGKSEKITGNFNLGFISSKLQLEIPVCKNTWILVSGRKTYFDILNRMFNSLKDDSGKKSGTFLSFYDFDIRLTSKLFDKNRIYLNLYSGDDKIEISNITRADGIINSDIYKTKTGNIVGSLTYNHFFNTNFSVTFLSGFTRYRTYLSFETAFINKAYPDENESSLFKQENYIFDYKNQLKYKYSSKNFTNESGIELINHVYEPFSVSYNKDLVNISETFRPLELAGFTDNSITIRNLTLNAGLRYTQYKINKKLYKYFEPRISSKYSFPNNFTVKASYTIMHQYNHMLSTMSIGFPVDIWYPVTESTNPMKSDQYTLGISKRKLFKIVDAGIEVYYKKMNDLIDFSEHVTGNLNITNIEKSIVCEGIGRSYGLEMFSNVHIKKFESAVSYTLSKTDRQFNEINSGEPYPFKYDRRHVFTSFFNYNFSERISLMASWTYMTGFALTIPIGRYYSPNTITDNQASLILFGERNMFRMPAYHRLDLSVKFSKKKKNGIRSWEISIYNFYNRKNAYYIEIHPGYEFNEQTQEYEYTKSKVWQRSLLPIIPTVSYSFAF